MKIKQKSNSNSKKVVVIGLASLVAVVGISAGLLMRDNSSAAADNKATEPVASIFTFRGAGDWTQGPSNETSMALFSKAAADGTSTCFVSVEYKAGTVDAAAELQKDNKVITHGGNTITDLGTKTLSIKTPSGDKQYELHQSKVVSASSSDPLMGGHELGFLQLSSGYLKVLGNCNTAEQLDGTIDALQAYVLNSEK